MTISTLNPNLPTDLEPAGQGAAEIRATRLAITTAFPAVDAQINNAGAVGGAGDVNPPDAATFSKLFDDVRALSGDSGVAAVPVGGIIMWSGLISAIPGGWVLCNGLNSTPNLQNRFIVGAGGLFTEGETSAGVYNPDKTLDTATGGAGTGTGTVTFPDHIIEEVNLPEHTHQTIFTVSDDVDSGGPVTNKAVKSQWPNSSGDGYNLKSAVNSTDVANVGITSPYGAPSVVVGLEHPPQDIDITGVEHDHVYGVPYLSLAYIMYTG